MPGKNSNLYVVDRTNMGKFNSGKNAIYQELAGALPGGIWSMPAAFDERIYYGPVGSPILLFQFKNAKLTMVRPSFWSLLAARRRCWHSALPWGRQPSRWLAVTLATPTALNRCKACLAVTAHCPDLGPCLVGSRRWRLFRLARPGDDDLSYQ